MDFLDEVMTYKPYLYTLHPVIILITIMTDVNQCWFDIKDEKDCIIIS